MPRTVAQTMPSRPSGGEREAGEVDRLACAAALGEHARARAIAAAMPTGTLTQKIQCHESALVSRPPAIGPSATPRPAIADHTPSARARRSAGTLVVSSVSVSGISTAPPAPWMTRAAISIALPVDSAAAAEEPVNSSRPATSILRRPKRSPSAAPVSMSTAKERM